jgi:N-acetylglutamate synthase-like GNAT family acetyltransferase
MKDIMKDIKITKAKEEDFCYIQEKIKKYLLDSTNIDWRQFFVAKLKNKTVSFGRVIDHGNFFEVASLGVDYYYRKKGIGTRMLLCLTQEARKMDQQKPIYSVTHLEQFFRDNGFVKIEHDYPKYLDFKRRHICRLDDSKISIMKWGGKLT